MTLQETLDEVLRLYRQAAAAQMRDTADGSAYRASYLQGRRDALEEVLSIMGDKRL